MTIEQRVSRLSAKVEEMELGYKHRITTLETLVADLVVKIKRVEQALRVKQGKTGMTGQSGI